MLFPPPSAQSARLINRGFLAALCGVLVAFAPSALSAGWAAPEGFFEEEKISRQEIAPGVVWIEAHGQKEGRPRRTHVLAVDLEQSGLELQTLLGARQMKPPGEGSRQFVPRSRVSELVRDAGALAGVNASFFDIKGTQAPTGLVVKEGLVLREPGAKYPSVLSFANGQVRIATTRWTTSLRIGGEKGAAGELATVNSPYLPEGKWALFLPPWKRTWGWQEQGGPKEKKVPAPPHDLTEVVVERGSFTLGLGHAWNRLAGRVREVRQNQPSVAIGPEQFVLTFKGEPPAKVREGDEVEVNWALWEEGVDGSPLAVREAVSGSPLLVVGGKQVEGTGALWRDRHPRTAVSIDAEGLKMLFVVVEGRSEASAGIELGMLGDYFAHMESHTALNLDGGGSSTLVTKIEGVLRRLNVASDGSERYVPTGLGVGPAPKEDAAK